MYRQLKKQPIGRILGMCALLLFLGANIALAQAWTYKTAMLEVAIRGVDVLFTPQNEHMDQPYSCFKISVLNKTRAPLNVHWEAAEWQYNGVKKGSFLFTGVITGDMNVYEPESILVGPGRTVVRYMVPLALVKKNTSSDEVIPQPLSSGEHVLFLPIEQAGHTHLQTNTVQIECR